MTIKMIIKLIMAAGIFGFSACNNSTTETKDSASTQDTAVETIADTSKPVEAKDSEMMQPMTSMMEKMNAVKLTGDVDNDFALLMIEHHQGAVDISEMEAARGSDSVMKSMANTMIADHKEEIANLKSFISHHDSTTSGHKGQMHEGGNESDLSETMKAETGKIKGIQTTGNADKDYAMLMLAHHEDAINLSKAEVAHGHHAELKKMAKKMMADDEKEVKIFKIYLSK